MYYNSNQNSNDYYSSYKKEMSISEEYETTNSLKQIFKIGLGVLFLGFMGVGSVYLFNYLSTEQQEKGSTTTSNKNSSIENLPKIILDKKILPKSIQLQTAQVEILEEIQLHATDTLKEDSPIKSKEHNSVKNQVIALSETSNMNLHDIDRIIKIILNKQKEQKQEQSSLEEELLHAELDSTSQKTLEESNHYNKVVLSSNREDGALTTLIQNAKNKKEVSTSYETSLKEESTVRLGEMRIIIVKKGDSLSKLAKKAYGDIHAYDKIFKANPEIIKNPNEIFIGQKIRIPL